MPPGRAPSQRRSTASASDGSRAASGEPVLTEQDVDEYIEVPDVIGGKEGDYILRLHSESMRSAGFLQGDYVVVRPTGELDAGMIVVVANEEEVTLMCAYRDGDELRVRPENEAMKPSAISEVSALGRVVGVIRKV